MFSLRNVHTRDNPNNRDNPDNPLGCDIRQPFFLFNGKDEYQLTFLSHSHNQTDLVKTSMEAFGIGTYIRITLITLIIP